MYKFKNFIYIVIGVIALTLGAIGVILPVLPTTPFLLLASYCFVKGSKKFDTWFKSTKLYEKHLAEYIKNRSMTLKQKITISTFADVMISFPLIILENWYVKGFLLSVVLYKYYYFIFQIKTIKNTI